MMKNFLLLLSLALFIPLSNLQAQDAPAINWMNMEDLEAASRVEKRPVIIDVYTDWCGWCKRMDKSTFSHPEIVKYINDHYYAVKFNAEQKDSVTFQGHTFKYIASGKRGVHELAATLLNGKMSYPSIVYLDRDLNMIQPVPGYMDAAQIEPVIYYFAEEQYKIQAFEDYSKAFTGKVKGG